MDSKETVRRRLKTMRDGISSKYQLVASAKICEQLRELPEYRSARTLAVYRAMGREIDLASIVARAWLDQKQVYLPVVRRGKALEFYRFTVSTQLIRSRFGIEQPPTIFENRIAVESLDLVVCPLVGFDHRCHRLGMGAGYYDRTFAFVVENDKTMPFLVGVAYEAQRVPILPIDEFDIPLTKIVTENGVLVRDNAMS